ncbi:hypothetical protein BJ165DRAFT_1583366 [Panaeolus papilionaceus]|nr:hypothetical protein BJ165DRAFT_1583366 [Panaeolus papilionaceus]
MSPSSRIWNYILLGLWLTSLCFATVKFDLSQLDPRYPIQDYETTHAPILDMLNRALPLMKAEVEAALDTRSSTHTTALANLKSVFGATPNLLQIKNMVVAYMSNDLQIHGDNIPLAGGDTSYAKTYKRQILFTTKYHDRTTSVNQRLRVLAHEGSHAISVVQTYDWWGSKQERPIHVYAISQEELQREEAVVAKQRAGETLTAEDKTHLHPAKINGYWQQSYNTLRDSVSDVMHLNADTWAVWVYRVLNGRLPPAGATVQAVQSVWVELHLEVVEGGVLSELTFMAIVTLLFVNCSNVQADCLTPQFLWFFFNAKSTANGNSIGLDPESEARRLT